MMVINWIICSIYIFVGMKVNIFDSFGWSHLLVNFFPSFGLCIVEENYLGNEGKTWKASVYDLFKSDVSMKVSASSYKPESMNKRHHHKW